MKIHFCDLCNESVPQSDLDGGRALMRKGRVICAKCDGLMSSSRDAGALDETLTGDVVHRIVDESDTKIETASRTAMAPRSANDQTMGIGSQSTHETSIEGGRARGPVQYRVEGGGGLVAGFLAAVAVVLVAVVAGMLMDRIEHVSISVHDKVANVQNDISAAEGDLVARLDDLKATSLLSAQKLETRLENFLAQRESRDAETTERLQAMQALIDELDARLAGLTEAEIKVADHDRALIALDSALANMRLEIAQLSADLEARPVVVAQPAAPASLIPAWMALTEDLKDPNSGVRWNKVADLGHTADPAVVPFIIPVLQDVDTFVRMEAARVLGNFTETSAISPLIDTLDDQAEIVREAAVSSLRKITGENFRYDPQAKEAERTKRARAWRDWWDKQQKA
jgi:hypothetical protein